MRPLPHLAAQPIRRSVIADGDPASRMLYHEQLRTAAVDLMDAVDGRDALVKCLVDPPSLVIADTRLQTLTGQGV
jgi:CheY-like chemotaxis protein